MFFVQTSLGPCTVHGLTLRLGTPLPPIHQTSQLFGEFASFVHLRHALLGIFTGGLFSPYFQH